MRDWNRPETVSRIAGVILALLVLGELFVPHHAVFEIEGTFGYPWYGFFGGAALLLLAKAMGIFLKRKDTYYDDD